MSDQRGTGYQLGSSMFKWCMICMIPFVLEFNKERMAEDDGEIALKDRAETWQRCGEDLTQMLQCAKT